MKWTWMAAGILAAAGVTAGPRESQAGVRVGIGVFVGHDEGYGYRYGNAYRIGYNRGHEDGLQDLRPLELPAAPCEQRWHVGARLLGCELEELAGAREGRGEREAHPRLLRALSREQERDRAPRGAARLGRRHALSPPSTTSAWPTT